LRPGPGFGITVNPDVLTRPLRWHKPRTVFVARCRTLFHSGVPEVIHRVGVQGEFREGVGARNASHACDQGVCALWQVA